MRRVMIIGQPGSGKSTLARELGRITFLPVYHIDEILWKPGWEVRPAPEKDRMCAEVHAKGSWIFEGGWSVTWSERLARADTLIWLDLPLPQRAWRIFWRTVRYTGRSRPDLPKGCPERFDLEFTQWVWRTRRTGRASMQRLFERAPAEKDRHHLRSGREVRHYLRDLRRAVAVGNLGIPHR